MTQPLTPPPQPDERFRSLFEPRGIVVAGVAGHREEQLATLAQDLGVLPAGPNGQGPISTPVDLCAQIVAPMPPAGPIGIANPGPAAVRAGGRFCHGSADEAVAALEHMWRYTRRKRYKT